MCCQQTVVIPIGTICACLLGTLFAYLQEADVVRGWSSLHAGAYHQKNRKEANPVFKFQLAIYDVVS